MTKVSRLEWLCAAGFFLLYLYINGAIVLRLDMSGDEILDFGGSDMARQVYMANGRWGIALWGKLVGAGYIPLVGGVTAGLILSVAYIMQCRLLYLHALREKVLYGVISLACFQFSFMQIYSMQVEGCALGILLATLSCMALIECRSMRSWKFVWCVFLLFCSLSFYQTCGVYFVVLYGLALLTRSMQGVPLHLARHGVIVVMSCACALVLFMAAKACILHSGLVDDGAAAFCRHYEKYIIEHKLFNSNAPTLAESIKLYVGTVKGQIFQCNSYTALLWCACSAVLLLRIYRQEDVCLREKMMRLSVYALTLGVPLAFYACFLNDQTHAYLFLPMLEAGTCALALKGVRLPK